jgi:hypothetical protein
MSCIRDAADQCSDFIEHLMSLPSPQKLNQAPIQLDQDQHAVRHFIDVMCISTETAFTINVELYRELLALSDMLQTPHIEAMVIEAVITHTASKSSKPHLDAWDLFKVAAVRDPIDLPKAAIRSFDACGHDAAKILGTSRPGFYDDIPSRYVYALMRATLNSPALELYGQRGLHNQTKSSKEIAAAFTL